MAYRDMPDWIVPPSHLRCEAMTKSTVTFQDWRRESHRCIKRATQSRAGKSVCNLHGSMKNVKYWNGEEDKFPHKKFWKWHGRVKDIIQQAAKDNIND